MVNYNSFELPLIIEDPNDFIKAFKNKCNYYYSKIDELKDLENNSYSLGIEKYLKEMEKNKLSVLDSYNDFFKGNNETAERLITRIFKEYKDLLLVSIRKSNAFNGLVLFDKVKEINSLYLYRGRIVDSYKYYDHKDYLHIPLNCRDLVNTYRFSMPGIPGLYLSINSYVVWNELGRPDLNNLSVSSFNLNELLDSPIIDISYDIENIYHNLNPKEISITSNYDKDKYVKLIALVPIIIATSIVCTSNRDRRFKIEYWFPQLLMNKLHKNALGIAYRSTKVNYRGLPAVNLAIPIFDFNKNGNYGNIMKKISNTDGMNVGYFKDFINKNNDITYRQNPLAKGVGSIISKNSFSFDNLRTSISTGNQLIDRNGTISSSLSYDGMIPYKRSMFYNFDEYLLYLNEFKKN